MGAKTALDGIGRRWTKDEWVHLRLCRTCGHVGCCDDSKNKHATKHFHQTKHPIITSLERSRSPHQWRVCPPDGRALGTRSSIPRQQDLVA
ncbi:MAG TPA: UBP-type zinc finger domain-containing protein [Burkholderiales bacterium]|nr:UBP-type zinc finger domain-containing protein [Burkholderiales bacterium]